MSLGRRVSSPSPKEEEAKVEEGRAITYEQAQTQLAAIHARYASSRSERPEDELPRLEEFPDDMSKQQATELIIRASRWLEYVIGRVARRRTDAKFWHGLVKLQKERLKFRYGNLRNVPQEEFDAVERMGFEALAADAELIESEGIRKTLNEVKSAASRCLTSHTTSNPAMAG